MPLQEADVKTFEAYKKAIRQEANRIKADGTTKFWLYAAVELPTAAGKKQKLPIFIALGEDRAIKPFLIGKKLACKGTCGQRDAELFFEPDQGKLPYGALKKAAIQFLGKPLYVPAGEDVSDEEQTETEGESAETKAAPEAVVESPSAPPPPPPPPAAPKPGEVPADLAALWKTLGPQAQQAMAANPARREELARLGASIQSLLQARNFDQARAGMERLSSLLNAAPPAPNNLTELNAIWTRLAKEAQQVIATHPERRDTLGKAAAGIQDLLKTGKGPEAEQRLHQLEALLHTPVETPSSALGELNATWQRLAKKAQEVLAAHPEMKTALNQAGSPVPELLRSGKLEAAKAALDKLESLLSGQPSADGKTPGSLIAYRKALLDYGKARSTVQIQIQALQKAIPSAMPTEAELASTIAARLAELNDELGDEIDAAINAANDPQTAANSSVRSKLDAYLAEIESDALIGHVENNPFGVKVTIRQTLGDALRKVESTMPA
jgi:hypothetical protein